MKNSTDASPSYSGDIMISVESVEKWYGDYHALTNINAKVKRGEVVVLCGPSGSGKSTLIRTMNGLEKISSGAIFVNGERRSKPDSQPHRVRISIVQPVSSPFGS